MDVLEQTMSVAVVLLLLGATLWWLRRRGIAVPAFARRSGGKRMECIERLPLGPQHSLHLIRLGEAQLLVASSPAGCVLLKDLSPVVSK